MSLSYELSSCTLTSFSVRMQSRTSSVWTRPRLEALVQLNDIAACHHMQCGAATTKNTVREPKLNRGSQGLRRHAQQSGKQPTGHPTAATASLHPSPSPKNLLPTDIPVLLAKSLFSESVKHPDHAKWSKCSVQEESESYWFLVLSFGKAKEKRLSFEHKTFGRAFSTMVTACYRIKSQKEPKIGLLFS